MAEDKQSFGMRFVVTVISRANGNNAFAARMSRADNPDTEYQALGDLCACGINVECDEQRQPCAVIGAALCRSRVQQDGNLTLGAALRRCQDTQKDGQGGDTPKAGIQDSPRLRRLLACDSLAEACGVLRQMLAMLHSKDVPLCHAALLDDLRKFCFDDSRQRVKRRWAQDFYGQKPDSDAAEET